MKCKCRQIMESAGMRNCTSCVSNNRLCVIRYCPREKDGYLYTCKHHGDSASRSPLSWTKWLENL